MVRPWNAPSHAMIRGRPVRRASLNAASLASAPELQKNTRPGCGSGAADVQQSLGEGQHGGVGEEVRDMAEGGDLIGDRLDDGRVGVAQRVDRDAAEQVQVLLAVGVGDHDAVSADEFHGRDTEVVHQRVLTNARQPTRLPVSERPESACDAIVVMANPPGSGRPWCRRPRR